MDRAFVEEYMKQLDYPADENGNFHLVFWSDKTLGVIQEEDIVSVTKTESEHDTGRARFDNQTYDVVFILKGTNEDDLFKLAQKITNDFGVQQNKRPQQNKRKPKRRKMDDFVETDEQVVSMKTGKSLAKGKKDAVRVEGKNVYENISGGTETKRGKAIEKKKTDKEEALKERKEMESSRVATMSNCASFILDTLSSSQSQLTDKVIRREKVAPVTRIQSPITKYYHARGPQVELCRFEDIPLTESPPADMMRLAEGELLCVPNTWMTRVLAISKGKGPAFLLKKMVDGFFEPEELQGRKAKELGNNNTIMRAIKMYAINELKMKETVFIHELNSKLNSCRRVLKERRNAKKS